MNMEAIFSYLSKAPI